MFSLCRKLLIDLYGGELKSFIRHPFLPEEYLFLMFDFTHNFKTIHNGFLSRNYMRVPPRNFTHIRVLGESCNAQFDHIKQLYLIEGDKSLTVANALKKVSLNPSSVARTSPQHALLKRISFLN